VAAVGALADQVGQQLRPLGVGQRLERAPDGVLRAGAGLEHQRRQQVVLVAVDVGEAHRWAAGGLGLAVEAQAPGPARARLRARLQVPDPLAAAVGARHAGDEARHHRLELVQDHRPVVAGLGQGVGQQVQDELLVGLPGGEDAHV
jgi:hypothetical protein